MIFTSTHGCCKQLNKVGYLDKKILSLLCRFEKEEEEHKKTLSIVDKIVAG